MFSGIIHLGHKVRPGPNIPGLDDGMIASVFKLHGNPFSPGSVFARVANEEVCVFLFARQLVIGHHHCSHFSTIYALHVHAM